MDKEIIFVVILVIHLIIAEWNVADSNIKAVVCKSGFLKTLYLNIRIGIELLCNSACQVIKFNTVKLAATHILGHYTKEIAYTHGRLQYLAFFKAEVCKPLIYCIYYNGRSVMRIQR